MAGGTIRLIGSLLSAALLAVATPAVLLVLAASAAADDGLPDPMVLLSQKPDTRMPGPPPPPSNGDPKLNRGNKTTGKAADKKSGDGMPGPPPPGDDPKLDQGGGQGNQGKGAKKEAPPDGMPGPAPGSAPGDSDPKLDRKKTGAPTGTDPALSAGGFPKHKITGSIGLEVRAFPLAPIHAGQKPQTAGLFGEIEYSLQLKNNLRFTLKPFFRWDATDQERTHFDLREAYLLKVWKKPRLELRFGVDKVFWGVTESVHLVDIINQDDLVENVDGEDKLGQPMLAITVPRKWGAVSVYLLPYFRPRTFPGRGGRLRSALRVEPDTAVFGDSRLRHWHPDFALRYSHTIKAFDIGLHYFRGTTRDPAFRLGFNGRELVLVPVYEQIDQMGVDAQFTKGPWLLKLEAIARLRQKNAVFREEDYVSVAGGFEYTFYRIFKTNADLGVLGEYLYDSRGRRAGTPFQNDIFVGFRVALNNPQDTQLLAGAIQDLRSPERSFFVEASTRIGSRWKLTLEARLFAQSRPTSPLFSVRRDNVFILELTYNFSRAWTGGVLKRKR